MPAEISGEPDQWRAIANGLKSWMMIALTMLFVVLYGAVLMGWIKPLADEKMVSHLEPIIFVIIGYYFGRMPFQENEKTLKDEISRQTQRADAAQHAKEQAQQARESLEEKMKNIRAILPPSPSGIGSTRLAETHNKAGLPINEDALRQSVAAALNILNS